METGTTLKHYRILSRLGEGGMGVVYRAEDTRLGRIVALKVLPASLAGDEDRLRRFQREARAASAITHPGIATLYDFDQADGAPFLTMEFVEGRTLKQLLEAGPLPLPELLDCLAQVADALAAAHRKGIVHRDLKPENVMAADSGFYKILDFGLARLDPGERVAGRDGSPTQLDTMTANMTQEGKILGTFAYMSPEQAQAEAVDVRSDLFSFGALAYELATGRSPFKRRSPIATFHAIVHEEPERLSAIRPEIPSELDAIVSRCLAKSPDDRYPTTAEMANDLRSLRRGSEASASVPRASAAGRRRPARWRLLAGAILLIAVAATAWSLRPARPEPAPEGAIVPLTVDAPPTPAVANRIVVARFTNQSPDPEDAWLTDGIPEMLTTDLARRPGLEVISTQRLQDLARTGGASLDDADGNTITRLARWAGAGIVVRGTIYRPASGYRIDLQAYDTASGTVRSADRVEGDDVFSLADDLSAGLLRDLALATGGEEGIGAVTTSSPDAYRLYTDGRRLYDDLQFSEAAERFQRATEIDPAFALAEFRLGTSLLLAGKAEAARRALQRAAAGAGRLPEPERDLLGALTTLHVDESRPEGEKRLAAVFGSHPEAAAEAYVWLARSRAASHDTLGAMRMLRRAIDADPGDGLAVAAMVQLLRDLDLGQEADAILADFLKRNPGSSAEKLREAGALAVAPAD